MSFVRKPLLILIAVCMAVLVASGVALAAQGTPVKQSEENATSEEVVFRAAALPADRYKIHSWWYVRYPGKYIPLRRGWHGGPNDGFGQRHIRAQRGWNSYIKDRMKVTLRKGYLVKREGTSRTVAYKGGKGCKWGAVYDLRKRNGARYPFGIVTFYHYDNDRDCP